MGSNQYLEWLELRVRRVEKNHLNFLKIYFWSNVCPQINFSKVFLIGHGIRIDQIETDTVMRIQPKISGKILAMHMVNDVTI